MWNSNGGYRSIIGKLPHNVHRSSLAMPPSSWDPMRIMIQIISLQLLYYVGLLLFWAILLLLHVPVQGPPLRYDHIDGITDWLFNVDYMDVRLYPVYTLGGMLLWLSIWSSFWIVSIVGKAKHCWDFSATILLYHWIFSWHHERSLSIDFSLSWTWWVIHLSNVLLTTMISERWCLHYELEPITVSSQSLNMQTNSPLRTISKLLSRVYGNAIVATAPWILHIRRLYRRLRSRMVSRHHYSEIQPSEEYGGLSFLEAPTPTYAILSTVVQSQEPRAHRSSHSLTLPRSISPIPVRKNSPLIQAHRVSSVENV